MKPEIQDGKAFYGKMNGEAYLIEDESAERFFEIWKNDSIDEVVKNVLQSTSFWDYDLSALPGFQDEVTEDLKGIMEKGMIKMLDVRN